GLRSHAGEVAYAGALEIGERLADRRTRIAVVGLAGAGLDDVAKDAHGGNGAEGIDEGGYGIRLHNHIGSLDALPASDRRPVEGHPFLEHGIIQTYNRKGEMVQLSKHIFEQ